MRRRNGSAGEDEAPPLDVRALLLAATAGAMCGAIALLFRTGLDLAGDGRARLVAALDPTAPTTWLLLAIVICGAAVLAGWLAQRFAPEAGGSGIPHVEEVLARGDRMRWRQLIPVKFTGGVLALGAGLSLGREGPTVQMGAAVADAVARAGGLSEASRLGLLAAGAGAGLAAAFNAPLAGFVFVLEELRRPASALTYSTGLLAVLMANLVLAAGAGPAPEFLVPDSPDLPASVLPAFVIVGLLTGGVGVLFNRMLLAAMDGFDRVWRGPRWLRPGVAGLLVVLLACTLPAAIGGGEPVADTILHGGLPADVVRFLAILVAAKLLLTVMSYASGAPGGLFAPLLVMGAALGRIVGELTATGPAVPALAMGGMVGLFVAVVRVPITGIVLILEMTDNQHLLLELTVTALAAYLVATALRDPPVYDALRERDERKAAAAGSD